MVAMVAAEEEMTMAYLTGSMDATLEQRTTDLAATDAAMAVHQGAVAPWGDGVTVPDVVELLQRLDLDADDVRRSLVVACYDRHFRATIDAVECE